MPELLTVEDLEVFADEATRQRLSLACLIAAMEAGEPLLWAKEDSNG